MAAVALSAAWDTTIGAMKSHHDAHFSLFLAELSRKCDRSALRSQNSLRLTSSRQSSSLGLARPVDGVVGLPVEAAADDDDGDNTLDCERDGVSCDGPDRRFNGDSPLHTYTDTRCHESTSLGEILYCTTHPLTRKQHASAP